MASGKAFWLLWLSRNELWFCCCLTEDSVKPVAPVALISFMSLKLLQRLCCQDLRERQNLSLLQYGMASCRDWRAQGLHQRRCSDMFIGTLPGMVIGTLPGMVIGMLPDMVIGTLPGMVHRDAARHGSSETLLRHGSSETLLRHGSSETLLRHVLALTPEVVVVGGPATEKKR